MMLLLRFLTLLLPLVATSPALAASVPLDAEPFTQYVARAFEKALPDADVTVSGPLHLSITAADGSASASFLGELHDYCKRNPDDCRKAIGEYVADMSPTYRDEPEPEKGPTTVTFVVRPQRYVDELNRETAKQGGPIAEQLVGDLWIIAANDQPKTIEMMTAEQAKQLDLTPKKILALAKRNLR
jgi:hypothetical protein